MPNITVKPVQQINVRVNQSNQQTVHGTATFIGAAASDTAAALQLAQAAYDSANASVALANSALQTANTKVSKTGDTMTGNLVFANAATIVAKIDGGTFS